MSYSMASFASYRATPFRLKAGEEPYFAILGVQPEVQSSYRPSREPGVERDETRTWRFPGLTIVGDFGPEIYLRSISVESYLYPLKCGIRVGEPTCTDWTLSALQEERGFPVAL